MQSTAVIWERLETGLVGVQYKIDHCLAENLSVAEEPIRKIGF